MAAIYRTRACFLIFADTLLTLFYLDCRRPRSHGPVTFSCWLDTPSAFSAESFLLLLSALDEHAGAARRHMTVSKILEKLSIARCEQRDYRRARRHDDDAGAKMCHIATRSIYFCCPALLAYSQVLRTT